MTKRTTTTARLCRFRKETERQAAACSTRRQDRLFVPVAAGKKRQACEARDQARSRANTDNDVGGAAGRRGSSCCGSRRRHAHIACGACCRGPFTNTCEPTVPTSPLTGLYPCSFPPSGGGIHKKSVLFFGTKDDYANRASFGGLLPQTKEGAQPKKKPKSATSRR